MISNSCSYYENVLQLEIGDDWANLGICIT